MATYQEYIRPITSLTSLSQTPAAEGAEKLVYQVTDGDRILAAKIFRTINQGSDARINRAMSAEREYNAYLRFRNSSVKDYVPQPYYLLTGPKANLIGLAVEWREGKTLNYYSRQKILSGSEIDQLESSLMNAWDNGVAPDSDMYSESNLIVAEGYSPRLWFAECIATRKSLVSHQRAVAHQIRYLKQHYVGNP